MTYSLKGAETRLRLCMRGGSLKPIPASQPRTPSTSVLYDGRAALGLKYQRGDVGQDHGQLPPQGLCLSGAGQPPVPPGTTGSAAARIGLLWLVFELGAHKGPKPEKQERGAA